MNIPTKISLLVFVIIMAMLNSGCKPKPVTYFVTINGQKYDGIRTSMFYETIYIDVKKDTVIIHGNNSPLYKVWK